MAGCVTSVLFAMHHIGCHDFNVCLQLLSSDVVAGTIVDLFHRAKKAAGIALGGWVVLVSSPAGCS